MNPPDKKLIATFDYNLTTYKKGPYNETQVRREFIDPLFEDLGWDITNKQGYAEAYKDVIHEDGIKIGGFTKAPDYCFRVGGVRKFFLEAKKPAINIETNKDAAYQLRRYGWSAKLPLSILTNFEEFAVYDCRTKPVKTDKASHSRILYLKYTDYIEHWEEINNIFSQEAILKGSFDKYSATKKKGTAEVDAVFLQEIERWREILAKNIALRNPNLSQRELNFAIQQTIDRIIFLRICEDRGIEIYGRLMALQNGEHVYKRLFQLFRKADAKYNSGLFHFKKEKNRKYFDVLTPQLTIDDNVLKDIFTNLYYPDSPYEFSVLPADILGQVYEKFLGKVIRLTPTHQAKIEEKPEVRKAGGVYYTPTYIVDYIVKQTIGKLVAGKSPKGVVSKLKILDPACGSGSFLIGAYQFLLDWHLEQYVNDNPAKLARVKKPRIYQSVNKEWRLTTDERKRILLNNIYGVDIDSQAVEVTKLSLLLKVLEGENEQTIDNQLAMFQERVLPDLENNIKCGNSLIGSDFYVNQQQSFDEEEIYQVNAFDWETEFADIMQKGGFDAVIGNPPYLFGRDWKALKINDNTKLYLRNKYSSSPYQLDMFSIFMELASLLCCNKGYVAQIVPNVWLTNTYSSKTRKFILSHSNELCILKPPADVFQGLTVDTIVYTYQLAKNLNQTFDVKRLKNNNLFEIATHSIKKYVDGLRPISTSLNIVATDLVFRIVENYPKLQEIAKITRGVHSYRIGGYGKTAFGTGCQTNKDVKERPYHSTIKKDGYRPFIYGRDLKRFTPPIPTEYVQYGSCLAEPRNSEFFEGTRIYSRKILADRLLVTIEQSDSIADQQVYITLPKTDTVKALYLGGILGSLFISFFIRGFYDEANDAFPQIKVGQLKAIPIRTINFSKPADKKLHDQMVNLVTKILDLNKKLAESQIPQSRNMLQRQIEATDQQIDQLVYKLYDLTDAEIKIVESSGK